MKRFLTASAAGIVYAVLAVVGVLLLVVEQVDGDTDEEILSYYADSGNRGVETAGLMMVTIGALFFLWFLSSLRSRLRVVEPEHRTLPDLAFGAGVAAATLFFAAGVMLSATSNAVEISSRFEVDPNLARLAVATGFVLLIGSVLCNCVLVAVTSVLALRSAVLPNWLGWVGFAALVLAIGEAFLLPVFMIPVWVLIVSVVLIMVTPTRPSMDA
ncbi:MAG: hypothetical protein OEW42_14765 [Acidimicrobiia bacterium]|nr:hypothetical protein [Acidimicrobiia bacterium]MDH5238859.1 hypothetical protein [Acidimicrobiia bacterium]